MTNANDARKAHKILDDLFKGNMVLDEEREFLRRALPERPKDATLDDLLTRVHYAWMNANPSYWGFDTPVEHHDWLFDLRHDLVRIIEEQDAPAAVPALPAGMRLADHEEIGRVVASPATDSNGERMIFCLDKTSLTGAGRRWAHEASLTFIDAAPAAPAEPAHPEFLETEADYQNAPVGTVAIHEGGYPWTRILDSWVAYSSHNYSHSDMAGTSRRVLRRGMGE